MSFLFDVEGHTFLIPMDRIRESMRYCSLERRQLGNNTGQECLVVVDQVIGVQQVVLHPIDDMDPQNGVIAGDALLGDGSVSLIVDVGAVYEAVAKKRLAPMYQNEEMEEG